MTGDPESLDPIVYGGDLLHTMSEDGAGRILMAPDIVQSNDFQADVAAPRELADNQETAAGILTFKGIDARTGNLKAVTIILSPEGMLNLSRIMKVKYVQIPIEYR